MKLITIFFFVSLLVFCPPIELQAQHLGGDSDGYALINVSNISLNGSLLAGAYIGGNGDGYAKTSAFSLTLNGVMQTPLLFRVERTTGNVYADGSFIPSGADLAERINISEPLEPGDVVELDPTRPGYYRKARGSRQLIAGVITTEPGFVLGNDLDENTMVAQSSFTAESTSRPMLALMGRVPVKVTTENGTIHPGDMLTVSSKKPGYAMRCADTKECEGAIIGKALAAMESGDGVILVLVTSH